MACDILAGRVGKVCKDSLGGNSSLYIFNFVEDPFTVVAGEATAINAALTTVFEFGLEGDGNTLTQDKPSDRNTGTSVNTTTLVAVLKTLDAPSNVTLNLLSAGYPQAVVKDRNGNYHAIGLDDGIDFAINSQTGGAKTDLNGYTITGVSTTKDLAPILDAATVTAFLALV
jgi:hypothetical protein